MKITRNTEIVLEDKKFLLEEGDEIIINEGIASKVVGAILKKVFPIEFITDFFGKMDPSFQSAFAKSIKKNPQNAEKWGNLLKKEPGMLDLFK